MDAPEVFDVGFVEQSFFGITDANVCLWKLLVHQAIVCLGLDVLRLEPFLPDMGYIQTQCVDPTNTT